MDTRQLYRLFFCSALVLLFSLLQVDTLQAQAAKNNYVKYSKQQRKWRYKSIIVKPGKVCKQINRRKKKPRRTPPHIVVGHKQTYAEGGAPTFDPYKNDPKNTFNRVNVERKIPKKPLEQMSLDEKHHVEDDVLKKNNLPEPTSEKHEQIRREVEKHLANFDNEKPIHLEPLYFVLDQDEFAFVDMDPFLVAVEYALQGKHVLIEGHTDNQGNSDYNVQLSIKRVERIRQLMVDMGVSDDHISVVGYGEEHSDTNNELANDKQLDRRVDFSVF